MKLVVFLCGLFFPSLSLSLSCCWRAWSAADAQWLCCCCCSSLLQLGWCIMAYYVALAVARSLYNYHSMYLMGRKSIISLTRKIQQEHWTFAKANRIYPDRPVFCLFCLEKEAATTGNSSSFIYYKSSIWKRIKWNIRRREKDYKTRHCIIANPPASEVLMEQKY